MTTVLRQDAAMDGALVGSGDTAVHAAAGAAHARPGRDHVRRGDKWRSFAAWVPAVVATAVRSGSCHAGIEGSSAAGSWCPVDGGAGELPSTGGARNEQRAGVPGGRCASDDGYAVAGRPEDGRQWRPGPLLPADRSSAGGDLGAVLVRGRAGADRRVI